MPKVPDRAKESTPKIKIGPTMQEVRKAIQDMEVAAGKEEQRLRALTPSWHRDLDITVEGYVFPLNRISKIGHD